MNLPVRVRASRQKAKLPSSVSFFAGCRQEVYLPTSNNLITKIPSILLGIVGSMHSEIDHQD